MKALVVNNSAVHSIDALTITEVPKPTPQANEVLIEVHAVGLNPVDYKIVEGGIDAWTYPHILGLDVAGKVVATGSAINDFQVGDRVSGHGNLAKNGCFAEFVVLPSYQLAKIPANVSDEAAASLLCAGLTAYQAIERKSNLSNVNTALIHAGAGGVGSTAIQLAKLHDIKVITTISSHKRKFVEALQPAAIIDYQTENVTARLMDLTAGQGVDLIINAVGKAEAEKDLQRLAYNGQLVTIVDVPRINASEMFNRGLSLEVVNLGGAHRSGNPAQQADLGQMNAELLALVSTGRVKPQIERVLPFDQIKDGLQAVKDHAVTGKLVVKI